MEFRFHNISQRPYRINNVDRIPTPRLLVFEDRIFNNIETMRRLLAAANPQLSLANVCPHVKTHKSKWVTQILLDAGISSFKTTLNELSMLIDAGARDIFIAYPLLEHDAVTVRDAMFSHPDIQFYVQVAHPEHVDILKRCTTSDTLTWNYVIDVNIGMNRTGGSPEKALELYQQLKADPRFQFAGIHGYDGHIHHTSAEERREQAFHSMQRLYDVVFEFHESGVPIPQTVVGGTPSFLQDAAFFAETPIPSQLYVSPGTWVYFDTVSQDMMPDTFDIAAVILTQVMDKPTPDSVTLNIGHKRWAVDQGPIDTFSIPEMRALHWNEEHTVVYVPQDENVHIGDYVLLAPRHVCPTVNLWEFFGIIDASGNMVSTESPVDARNR